MCTVSRPRIGNVNGHVVELLNSLPVFRWWKSRLETLNTHWIQLQQRAGRMVALLRAHLCAHQHSATPPALASALATACAEMADWLAKTSELREQSISCKSLCFTQDLPSELTGVIQELRKWCTAFQMNRASDAGSGQWERAVGDQLTVWWELDNDAAGWYNATVVHRTAEAVCCHSRIASSPHKYLIEFEDKTSYWTRPGAAFRETFERVNLCRNTFISPQWYVIPWGF